MKPSSAKPQSLVLIVPPEQAGKRLDMFLVSEMPAFSRTQIQGLIQKGLVVPNFPTKAFKSGWEVAQGQSFTVNVPPSAKSDIPSQRLSLDIVFEDANLLVVNKPVGLVVHPGAGNQDKTLINALVAHCPDLAGVGGVQRPGLVHRLDKDTSGLMVVAKSDLAYKSLVKQLKTRKLSREYLGIVKGPLKGNGKVDAPIARHATARKKMAVRPENGKKAVTHIVSLESNELACLVHLKLDTGRTHQIRVHMAYIKHPILGDSVYGDDSRIADRQMLHAFRISFEHPKTGRIREFFANPPGDFEGALSNVNLEIPQWEKLQWEKKRK